MSMDKYRNTLHKEQGDKVSVIIPVYNAEKFLHDCLDSILLQTYQHWECLLVNDGSTDSSQLIINEYYVNFFCPVLSLKKFESNINVNTRRKLLYNSVFTLILDSDKLQSNRSKY